MGKGDGDGDGEAFAPLFLNGKDEEAGGVEVL